ncbi:MAG: DUF4180 domain-containing protein, partial [Clostridia bacterium]|nr:DUF4180 domain-containing protein [Clostridia bacterium]
RRCGTDSRRWRRSRRSWKKREKDDRIAIYGDFSRYTSKPLKDFMRESNRGRDVFFAATEEEAIAALTR